MTAPRWTPAARLVRGALTLMISTVAGSALGVVFWTVGARLDGTQELGRASAGFSAITLLGGVAQLSLGTVLVRFLPTSGRYAGRIIGYAQLASASLGIIVASICWFAGLADAFLPDDRWSFLFFCGACASAALTTVHDGALTGLGATPWVPARTIAAAVARLALLVGLLGSVPMLLSWGLPLIAVALLTTAAVGIAVLRRPASGAEVLPTQREVTSFATSQYLSGIVGSLGQYAPPVLVTLVLGAEANGASFHIPWLIAGVATALAWNGVVSFVVEATREPHRMRAHVRHLLLILAAILGTGGLALAVVAPVMLGVLGEQYRAAGTGSLRAIGLALPFLAISSLYSAVAMVDKRTWPLFWVGLVSNAAFLGGAYWGLHAFGVIGAAGAFLGVEVAVGLALLPVTLRRLRELVAAGERAAAPARGVARVPARATPEVAAVGPGFGGGPVTVVFFPDLDGSLAAAQTAQLRRIRPEADATVQFSREDPARSSRG